MADLETTGFISLAEMALMSTDDIKTLTSRVSPAGLFRVKGLSVSMKQAEPRDDGKAAPFNISYSLGIIGGKPIDKALDIETLLGKKINYRYTIWPEDFVELVGLLKGNYQKVGLPNSGMAFGGVEGQEPGWVDTVVNHEFDIRCRTYTDKTGETRNAFDWLPPAKDAAAAAA